MNEMQKLAMARMIGGLGRMAGGLGRAAAGAGRTAAPMMGRMARGAMTPWGIGLGLGAGSLWAARNLFRGANPQQPGPAVSPFQQRNQDLADIYSGGR